ncbi:QueT transporter family protein [Selenomonas sp. WCT3]|uniref:QueT transporter family protein n=1 Tax=Selenomonas sp. WCT3 TaxID=3158785 RepID=UPI000943F776
MTVFSCRCKIYLLLTGCAPFDIVFGSLATLLGAWGTYALRNKPWLAWIAPVISNTLIIPPIIIYVYAVESFWPLLAFQFFIGETISCGLLGSIVLHLVQKHGYIHR